MNARARVLAVVNGQELYPVPRDVTVNLIHPKVAESLMRTLRVRDGEGLLSALGAHLRWANPQYVGPPLEIAPVQPLDPWPDKRASRNIWGGWSGLGTYSDQVIGRPLAKADTPSAVEKHPWPDPNWFDYSMVAPNVSSYGDGQAVRLSQWVEEHADYARLIGGYMPIFGTICDLCGIEEALIKTAVQNSVVHAISEHIADFLEAYYRGIAEAAVGHVDIMGYGDDFAGQNGMLLSPKRWREYFKHHWARLFSVAHEFGMKALFHSCGAVRPVLGDLIDVGLDILQVVQIGARGMDAVELKREFGAHLTFYGAMDVQQVLPTYTPDAVRAETRRLIDIFGTGGRYIFTSTHLIWPDVPPENVLAMYDEAASYRPFRHTARPRHST